MRSEPSPPAFWRNFSIEGVCWSVSARTTTASMKTNLVQPWCVTVVEPSIFPPAAARSQRRRVLSGGAISAAARSQRRRAPRGGEFPPARRGRATGARWAPQKLRRGSAYRAHRTMKCAHRSPPAQGGDGGRSGRPRRATGGIAAPLSGPSASEHRPLQQPRNPSNRHADRQKRHDLPVPRR